MRSPGLARPARSSSLGRASGHTVGEMPRTRRPQPSRPNYLLTQARADFQDATAFLRQLSPDDSGYEAAFGEMETHFDTLCRMRQGKQR